MNLSRHLTVLADAGLVVGSRRTGKGRPKVWVTITHAGGEALDAELAALRALIGAAE